MAHEAVKRSEGRREERGGTMEREWRQRIKRKGTEIKDEKKMRKRRYEARKNYSNVNESLEKI